MGTPARATDGIGYASVVVIGVGLASSILSNVLFGRGIGDVSCTYTVKYSPAGAAFGIWFPIYVLGLLTIADQLNVERSTRGVYDDTLSNFCYGVAWLMAAAWTPAFTRTTKVVSKDNGELREVPSPPHLALAALFLCLTAIMSMIATFASTAWSKTTPGGIRSISGMAYASLAGWTLVAASINVIIAWNANDNIPDEPCNAEYPNDYNILSRIDPKYATSVPLVLSVVIALMAGSLSNPILPLPLMWALIWIQPSYMNYAALALIVVSFYVATFRVLNQ